MCYKRDNVEIMINDKADEVIEGIFDSFIKKYQIGLEKSVTGSDLFILL